MKDILVVSHERSGTHLTIDTIGLKMKNVPIPGFGYIDNMNITDFILNNKFNGIWKSHHQSYYFDVDKLIDNIKIIYIKRNIKDTLTSAWYYFKSNQIIRCNSDINKWVFDKPIYRNGDPYNKESDNIIYRYINHINSWMGYDILYLNYEDFHNDFKKVKDNIENYLGIKIKDKKPKLGGVNPRKGIIGDYKNIMSKDTIDKIENILKKEKYIS